MNREELSSADFELVAAAIAEAKKPVLQLKGKKDPALVAAALRLNDGKIITATNLIASVRRLSVCAEAVAIAKSAEIPDNKIATIAAVYHSPGQEPMVVSPCGNCRELITDYSLHCFVILREPNTDKLFKVKASELLPFKYSLYKDNDKLI